MEEAIKKFKRLRIIIITVLLFLEIGFNFIIELNPFELEPRTIFIISFLFTITILLWFRSILLDASRNFAELSLEYGKRNAISKLELINILKSYRMTNIARIIEEGEN